MQFAVQHTGRLQGRPLNLQMKNELTLQLLSSLNLLSYALNLLHFLFCLLFFFHGSVTVAKAVSHSAVWDLQSAAKISSSRRPVAVANENHNP